jgi:hypothetical protein
MNVLIFTQKEYNKVIAIQEGQHRITPVDLTNSTYFVMEYVLNSEIVVSIKEGMDRG